MKKIFILIFLSILFSNCSKKEEQIDNKVPNSKFSFSYKGTEYNYTNDIMGYEWYNNEYLIQLNSEKTNPQWRIGMEGLPSKPSMYFENYGNIIQLTHYSWSITSDNGTLISGTFKSDQINGKFDNITKRN